MQRTYTPTANGNSTEKRSLMTRKGRSVETIYTDAQALEKLAEVPGDFAADLNRQDKLSHDQVVWTHILVMRHFHSPDNTVKVGNFDAFNRIFDSAKKHLKWPKLALRDDEGHGVVLSVASPASKNAGQIYVKSDYDQYWGRIDQSGNFHPRDTAPSTLATYLAKFAQNPEAEAARYGKLMGCCCFCRRSLTDERSTDVGYGPQCAAKWGLSWGTKKR